MNVDLICEETAELKCKQKRPETDLIQCLLNIFIGSSQTTVMWEQKPCCSLKLIGDLVNALLFPTNMYFIDQRCTYKLYKLEETVTGAQILIYKMMVEVCFTLSHLATRQFKQEERYNVKACQCFLVKRALCLTSGITRMKIFPIMHTRE